MESVHILERAGPDRHWLIANIFHWLQPTWRLLGQLVALECMVAVL